jgi:pimeloyl-ACP methyl ester carboxylesterase
MMANQKWIRISAAFCLSVLFVLTPILCLAAGRIGVVLMHGKGDTPDLMAHAAGRVIQEAGFFVDTPEMPWSKNRYIDKTYEGVLDEITQAAERLRKKGANKIVIAGYSMGSGVALAYAAYHGRIDGVILLAPEHTPDSPSFKKYQTDVAKAKSMLDDGHGEQTAVFMDGDRGVSNGRNLKASIYYSYFNPEGLGAMSKAASFINPKIPVLYVVGSQDPLTASLGKGYAFKNLPENKLTRYVNIYADHLGTPLAAVGVVINWLKELAKQ